MKAMNIGDQAFFYHSVKEKQVVGIVEVCSEYYLDPSDESGRFGMVDFQGHKTGREAGHAGGHQGNAGIGRYGAGKNNRACLYDHGDRQGMEDNPENVQNETLDRDR